MFIGVLRSKKVRERCYTIVWMHIGEWSTDQPEESGPGDWTSLYVWQGLDRPGHIPR